MPTGTTDAYPLWLYYRLDESFGPTITDYSGNGRSGTIGSGTSTSTTGGQYGGCLTLSNGSISIPTFLWAAPVTVAFWVKQQAAYDGTSRSLFRTTDDLAGLYIDSSNHLQFVDSSGLSTTNSTSPLTSSSGWMHIAVAVTSSTGIRLMVNGTSVYSGGGFSTSGMSSTKIGYNGTMATHGIFDDFRIYQGDLSATDITNLIATQSIQLLKPSHSVVAGTATLTYQYQGTATIPRSHPLTVGSSHFPIPGVTATAAIVRNHPMIAATAHAETPIYTGAASPTKHPTISGSAVSAEPTATYTGSTPTSPPLFLYYKFDETTDFTCADSSGNGRDGTSNMSTFTSGKFNNCIGLGFSNYVTPPTITWDYPMTASFWYRGTGGAGTNRSIISDASSNLLVYVSTGEKFAFLPGTSGLDTAVGTTSIIQNTWYHCVAVIASSSSSKLYVNGILEATKTGITLSSKTSDRIGFDGFYRGQGDVDDLRIYDTALTDAQISDLYAGVDLVGNLISTHATTAGTATMTTSVVATATLSQSSIATSTANFVNPAYVATTTLSARPIVTSTASGTPPIYTGESSAARNHTLVSGTGIKLPEGTISLWMSGSDGTHWVDNLPLLIIGAGGVDQSLDLVLPKVVSQPLASNLDLYLDSSDVDGLNIGMNLMVKAGTWASKTTVLPCSITGGDQDVFASIPLMITGTTPMGSSLMNLVVMGPDREDIFNIVNLSIKGGGVFIGDSLPLYLANTLPTTSSLKLFIMGPEGTPGAIPLESFMNLWMEWGAQGVLPLVINPGVASDSTLLYVTGLDHVEDYLVLSITGDGGVIYNSLDLVLPNVYMPTTLNNSIDIAMPKTLGFINAICTTHINGWK